jgi:hypothetical protein
LKNERFGVFSFECIDILVIEETKYNAFFTSQQTVMFASALARKETVGRFSFQLQRIN